MAEEKDRLRANLCRILTKIGALKFGTFELAGGRLSPYYVDLRIVPSFPDVFQKVCDLYADLITLDIGAENFDRIAGIATAGISFASVLAHRLKKPFFYVRQHAKAHGRERRIEGILIPGNRVVLVDDLITSGRSLMNAAAAIRAEGGVISDAVVLVDREEGGKQNLAKANITLHCLLKVSEAANRLSQMGIITEDQHKIILKQVKQ